MTARNSKRKQRRERAKLRNAKIFILHAGDDVTHAPTKEQNSLQMNEGFLGDDQMSTIETTNKRKAQYEAELERSRRAFQAFAVEQLRAGQSMENVNKEFQECMEFRRNAPGDGGTS